MSQFQRPATLPELRQRVYASIDKLSDRATFSQASSELHFIARTLSSDSLSYFLACILSVDASSKSSVRVHCLNLLSLLANTHHYSLYPHLTKTIIPFLLRRLRDGDSTVRTACANAVGALSPVGFSTLLPSLLNAVVSEQECNAQIGSCLCLKAAVDGASVVGSSDEAELRRVFSRMLKIVRVEGFKAKAALLGLIGSIVGVNGGGVVNGKGGLMGSAVGCAVEMLSCEDWAARKAAAEVLEAAAEVVEEELGIEVKGFVVGSLESRRFDKVKATREIMNRALEAWKKVPCGSDEEEFPLPLSKYNSSFSKDNAIRGGSSPPMSRRSSFAGTETRKQKKTTNQSRSSLSHTPISSISSSISSSINGPNTHQRKKTISYGRPSLSDDSTITDSSSVSKSSRDVSFESPQSKKPISKSRCVPNGYHKKPLDRIPQAPSEKDVLEDNTQPQCDAEDVNFFNKTSEERVHKSRGWRSKSRVVPFIEKEESCRSVIDDRANEEVCDNNADNQDLSLIRNQLLQIERQQSYHLDLLQRFMGNSQNVINSLETRVSGLERALDKISYDLGLQSGRIQKNSNACTTCCSSTEFLSPKFWSSTSKSPNSGRVTNKDGNMEPLQMDDHRFCEQNSQRGRTCSPISFDATSNALV